MVDLPRDSGFWTDLLRRVVRRTRGRSDAEDLLHSAYLRLESYRAEHTIENPAAFVVQTAANLAIDAYRHDRFTADAPDDTALLDLSDEHPLQDEVIEARARLKRVGEGLFDRQAPLVLNVITGSGFYDVIGRAYNVGVRVTF